MVSDMSNVFLLLDCLAISVLICCSCLSNNKRRFVDCGCRSLFAFMVCIRSTNVLVSFCIPLEAAAPDPPLSFMGVPCTIPLVSVGLENTRFGLHAIQLVCVTNLMLVVVS